MSQSNSTARDEIATLFNSPILDLVYRAATVHRQHHDPRQVQVCTLLSIKTGGCPEDCGYCSQSAHFDSGLERQGLLSITAVDEAAKQAAADGSTRFCMGAAWRQVRDGEEFDRVLEMVRAVAATGMEVCCTLGMLNGEQAQKLKEAGLTAYNHNLDTGENYYSEVVTTRTYQDRIETIGHVGRAGISVCCGGILGLGESDEDRIDLLHALSQLPTQPESIPVNTLVPIAGTPLGDAEPASIWDQIRMVACARILFPEAMVRLSAGRDGLSAAAQALCFLAGANSIFSGDKLLTTPHPGADADQALFDLLDLEPRPSHRDASEFVKQLEEDIVNGR
ncbi:MAG: biotin synthase BioB [Candidatus Latescibacterota bacterium]|nr:biotin synthase BioB [Candidatus Latescibacterota bacterium]